MIRSATIEDAAQICDIYNYYVLETTITFEEQPVSPEEMKQRISETLEGLPWLVWEDGGRIQGFAYASKWKSRSGYRYSVESTVYLHPDMHGKGIGSRLYQELLNKLRQHGIHAVIGGIVLPNAASMALHEKLGFKKIVEFKEVGRKFDRWINVGYWQLLL